MKSNHRTQTLSRRKTSQEEFPRSTFAALSAMIKWNHPSVFSSCALQPKSSGLLLARVSRQKMQTSTPLEGIIKLILNPTGALCQSNDLWLISPNMALILDEIWHLRNNVLFSKSNLNIPDSIKSISRLFKEFSSLENTQQSPPTPPPPSAWVPPPPSWIKLNVDATLSPSKASLVVIARDRNGNILNVWAKLIPSRTSLQAKAKALLWAVQLAKFALASNHSCFFFNGNLPPTLVAICKADYPSCPFPSV